MNIDAHLRDRYWHLLCHASELPQSGDFLKLRWLDQDVVVASDQGNLLVFDNVCPHRGAKFFVDEFGNKPISCRYHGWTYQANELFIPGREKFEEKEVGRLSLSTLKVDWCGDFLFASSSPAQGLDIQLGDLYQQVASISMDIHGRHDWNAYTYECDWKIAVENALDFLHVPFVHNQSLNRLCLSEPMKTFSGVNSIARFKIRDDSAYKRLKMTARLFSGTERFEGYLSVYLFPFTMFTSTFGLSYSLQHFFPSEFQHKTNFYSRLLRGTLRPGLRSDALNQFFDSTTLVNRTVFEEDNAICREIDFKRYSFNELNRLSSEDDQIVHFRKNMQMVATEATSKFQ
jgi:phenylpropionate dioxygenase-like ring-hydroxylating dioxygenase large terminal subunit